MAARLVLVNLMMLIDNATLPKIFNHSSIPRLQRTGEKFIIFVN